MFWPTKSKKNKHAAVSGGFTLVELLVTIAIIAVLTGAVLNVINVKGLKAESRDSQRIADLKKVQTALELYFADNRVYITSPSWSSTITTTLSSLQPSYINTIPVDPVNTGAGATPCVAGTYKYFYRSSTGSNYVLAVQTEVSSSADASVCSALNNASSYGLTTCGAPCYGVENP